MARRFVGVDVFGLPAIGPPVFVAILPAIRDAMHDPRRKTRNAIAIAIRDATRDRATRDRVAPGRYLPGEACDFDGASTVAMAGVGRIVQIRINPAVAANPISKQPPGRRRSLPNNMKSSRARLSTQIETCSMDRELPDVL
jgi:hypothetical protein